MFNVCGSEESQRVDCTKVQVKLRLKLDTNRDAHAND